MTGQKPNVFILLCWKYISPIIILLLLCGTVGQYMYSAATDQKQFYYTAFNPKHNENVVGDVFLRMPGHILGLGFSLMIFCIMWIPIHMCLRYALKNYFFLFSQLKIFVNLFCKIFLQKNKV